MSIKTLFKTAGFLTTAHLVGADALIALYAATNTWDYLRNQKHTALPEPDASPLLEFMNFAKTRTDIVILGDTDHSNRKLNSLISSNTFAKELGKQGYRHLFLEIDQSVDEHFTKHREKKITREKLAKNLINEGLHGRLWRNESKTLINRLAQSAEHINVRPIDWRKKSLFTKLPLKMRACHFFASACKELTSIFTPRSPYSIDVFFIALGVTAGNTDQITASILDDTDTAKNVMKVLDNAPNKKSVIIYGAGHADGTAEKYRVPSLTTELTKHGHTPIVINLYPNNQMRFDATNAAREDLGDFYRPASADYLLDPIHGQHIIFNDELLRRAFTKHKNERQTKQFSRVFSPQQS